VLVVSLEGRKTGADDRGGCDSHYRQTQEDTHWSQVPPPSLPMMTVSKPVGTKSFPRVLSVLSGLASLWPGDRRDHPQGSCSREDQEGRG
jgi:hypothetical protein